MHFLCPSISQVNQLDSQSAQAIESVGTLYVMKSKTLQDSHAVDGIFKSKVIATGAAAQEVQDIFPEVRDTLCWFNNS